MNALFSTAEVARLAEVTERTLQHWDDAGILRAGREARRPGMCPRRVYDQMSAMMAVALSDLRARRIVQVLGKDALRTAAQAIAVADLIESDYLVYDGQKCREAVDPREVVTMMIGLSSPAWLIAVRSIRVRVVRADD